MDTWATERLPLQGAWNVRELGGYPAGDGSRTREKKYLRGDGLENLTEQDCALLHDHGVRMVVDLRCRSEWEGQRLPLAGYRDMVYTNVPLLDDVIEEPSVEDFPESLGVQYVRLLERYKQKIRTIFHCFSGHTDQCVLFHCAAGKDRTGVVAMLLLLLAEVPEEYIVADYVKTDLYIRGKMDVRIAELAARGIEYPEHVFRAHPDNIHTAMEHLRTKYGGGVQYLEDCGLREPSIRRVAGHFTGG